MIETDNSEKVNTLSEPQPDSNHNNEQEKFVNVWIKQSEQKNYIKPKHCYQIKDNDIFCLRYSYDGNYLAVGKNYKLLIQLYKGCTDGKVNVYNTKDQKLSYSFQPSPTQSPTTILRWRPKGQGYHSQALLVGNCEGSVSHFHSPSGKLIFRNEEPENQVLGMDYRDDGALFATGGKDFVIRIYDEHRKAITTRLNSASWEHSGHSNRVFAVTFLPSTVNPNLLLSGGWDSSIHLWDLRNARSVANFYGANVSGDSVKYHDEQIFIGSYRKEPSLEIYDWRTMQLTDQLWSDEGGYVYGIEVSNGKVIGAGGGKEARVYSKKKEIGRICSDNPWYGVDWGYNGNTVAMGGTGGEVYEFYVQF